MYEDDRPRLRKLQTWDAKAIYEDEETGLLKTVISGEAFNWYGHSSFATLDGEWVLVCLGYWKRLLSGKTEHPGGGI